MNLRFRPQSLSAPARLATVGSEAAETMNFLHHGAEMTVRKSPGCQRQGGRKARLDDTPNPGELP